jgi:MFS family permease
VFNEQVAEQTKGKVMSDLDQAARTEERTAAPARMSSRQKQILVVLLGAQFMLCADFTILTVALPVIGDSLGFTLNNLQWITTGFALPAAGFTLVFGRAADLFGRRRVFLAGLGLLTIASLVGGTATTPAVLVAARVAQGLATAISVPSGLSLITTVFPEGPLRQRALGLNGALSGAGFTAGALLGGTLTDVLSWRWSFLINVPIALALIAGTLAVIQEGRGRSRVKLDIPGALTVTAALLALVYGITSAGRVGWSHASVIASLVVAAILLGVFWAIEQRSPNPLAPPYVLRKPTVRWGNLGGMINIAMGTGISFLMTLYMQKVLGYSAILAGVALGAPGLLVVVGGSIAPKFIGRFGAPAALAGSMVVQCVAYGALLFVGESRTNFVLVLVALAVGFFAHAFGLVSYLVTATSGLPDQEQGLATGLTTMSMQVGITLGIPILSAIATAGTSSTSRPGEILSGLHSATLVNALILLAAGIVVWLGLRSVNANTTAAAAESGK